MNEDTRQWVFLFTIVGLIATSQALFTVASVRILRLKKLSWMIRGSVVPALLSIFLLVPAVELFWLFLVHFLSLLGISSLRRRSEPISEQLTTDGGQTEASHIDDHSRKSFSLASVLYATTIVACLVVLARITPEQNVKSISSLCLIGLTAGVVGAGTIAVAERVSNSRKSLLARCWPLIGWWLAAILLHVPLASFDWLLLSIMGDNWLGWPPSTESTLALGTPSSLLNMFWLAIGGIQMPVLLALVILLRQSEMSTRRRLLSTASLIPFAALPAYALVYLLWPLDTQRESPSPNAHEEIVALADRVSALSPPDWDAVSKSVRTQTVAQIVPELDRLELLIHQPYRVPLTYTWSDLNSDHIINLRNLAITLASKGKWEMDREPDQACDTFLQGLQFSLCVRKEGLLVHGLIGKALAGISLRPLVENRRYYSAVQCRSAAEELLRLVEQIEPVETFLYRDRIWSQAVHWTGKLNTGVATLFGLDLNGATGDAFTDAQMKEIAFLRMASLALAAEAFHRQYSRYPSSLDELSTSLQIPMPIDPFSPTGQTFVYRLTDASYTLYSLGRNRVDDGGKYDPSDLYGILTPQSDLFLFGMFPEISTAPTNGGPY